MSYEWLLHLKCENLLRYRHLMNQSTPTAYDAETKTNHWTRHLRPGIDLCELHISYTHPTIANDHTSTSSVSSPNDNNNRGSSSSTGSNGNTNANVGRPNPQHGHHKRAIPANMVLHLRCELALTYEDVAILIQASLPQGFFDVTSAIAHPEDIADSIACLNRDFIGVGRSFVPMVTHKFFLRRYSPTHLHFVSSGGSQLSDGGRQNGGGRMDVTEPTSPLDSSTSSNTATVVATAQQVDNLSHIVKLFRSHGMNNDKFRTIAEKMCIDAMLRRDTTLMDTNEMDLRRTFYEVDLQMASDTEYDFIALVMSGNEAALDAYMCVWNTTASKTSPYFNNTIAHGFGIDAVNSLSTSSSSSSNNANPIDMPFRTFRNTCMCTQRHALLLDHASSTEEVGTLWALTPNTLAKNTTPCCDPRHTNQLKDDTFFLSTLSPTPSLGHQPMTPYPPHVLSLHHFAMRATNFARDSNHTQAPLSKAAHLWSYDVFTVVSQCIFRDALPKYFYLGMATTCTPSSSSSSSSSPAQTHFDDLIQTQEVLQFGRYKHLQFMESLLFLLGHWPALVVLKMNVMCRELEETTGLTYGYTTPPHHALRQNPMSTTSSSSSSCDYDFGAFATARLFLQGLPDPLQKSHDRFVFPQKARTYAPLHHTMHWMEVFRLTLGLPNVLHQSHARMQHHPRVNSIFGPDRRAYANVQACAARTSELAQTILRCCSHTEVDLAVFWWMLSLPPLMESCASFLLLTRNFAYTQSRSGGDKARKRSSSKQTLSKAFSFVTNNSATTTIAQSIDSFTTDHISTLFQKANDDDASSSSMPRPTIPQTLDLVATYQFPQSSSLGRNGVDWTTALLSLVCSQYQMSVEMQSAHSMCVLYAKFMDA